MLTPPPREPPQTTDAVLMIRPYRFGWNPQTADSNTYQVAAAAPPSAVHAEAEREQAGLQALLTEAGIQVTVFSDQPTPPTPDAIFPNNWFSTHPDGTLVLYPMAAPNRRAERRPTWIAALQRQLGSTQLFDLTHHENAGRFLEGTGSLVLDRAERVAYAARSLRTHPQVAGEFAARLGYRLRLFSTRPQHGQPVYHTNVMMSVGEAAAVVCLDVIADPDERAAVATDLQASGRDLVTLSCEQLQEFAGNVLQLRNSRGNRFWVMSSRAHAALLPAQRRQLERSGQLLHAPLATIESVGGGSARCMLAELFAPRPAAGSG